jgi:GH25 family lysozyme M1 (1,4-beta-N-acetylmuramidase)
MTVTENQLLTGHTVRTYYPVAGVQSAQFIDVSDWQGSFEWAAAKTGVPDLAGGMFRVSQGLGGSGTVSPDPDAAHNHSAIRDAGLHRGGYHFLDPYLPGDQQADYFVSEYGRLGIVPSDILALDSEAAGSSPAQVSDCAGLFMEQLVKLRPHNPRWVYTFIDFIKEGNCAGLGKYPLWLAYPNASAPVPPMVWTKWSGWQWGTRPAGGQNVDADAFNGTAAQFSAWIASFGPPSPGQHTTDGSMSLREMAASRGMSVEGWLALQAKLGGQGAADALGSAVPKAGIPWYTVS